MFPFDDVIISWVPVTRYRVSNTTFVPTKIKWCHLGDSKSILDEHFHRWPSDAGISRLGHPKMAAAFPGNQQFEVKSLRLWASCCNRHSPDLYYIYIWVGMDCDNRIWQKRCFLKFAYSVHLLLTDILRDHWTIGPLCTGKSLTISQPMTAYKLYKVQPWSRTMIQIISQQQIRHVRLNISELRLIWSNPNQID